MRSTGMPAAAITALASLPAAAMRAASAAASRPSSIRFTVCTMSWRRSASTQPSADVMPGKRGTTRALQADLADQRADMQRAAAAERHRDELLRIVPALDRHEPDRARHARVRDAHDRGGGIVGRKVERLADMLGDRAPCRLDIERLQFAAERALRIDAAEHDLRVGQCRPRVALSRSRQGPAPSPRFPGRPATARRDRPRQSSRRPRRWW